MAVYYFGYASNLEVGTLKSRLQSDPEVVGVGILSGFGFRFNYLNPDGSARANIVPSDQESVYGLVLKIEEDQVPHFLKSEPGYQWVEKELILTDGTKVKAFTFISSVDVKGIYPKEEYWKPIIIGGRNLGLPPLYLSHMIERAGADPDELAMG